MDEEDKYFSKRQTLSYWKQQKTQFVFHFQKDWLAIATRKPTFTFLGRDFAIFNTFTWGEIWKKILQNSRETRLSQVAGPEWERPPYFSRHRKILILFSPKYSFVILVLVHVPLGHLLPHILWHNPPHFWTFAVPFFRCGSISSIYWLDSTSCQK